ncbi:NOV [Symbiodinium sp. CCMP2456]|nr:NOV [Symbiodinium sp. CCMP2456]
MPKGEDEEEEEEEDDDEYIDEVVSPPLVSNPCATGPSLNFNYWDRGRQASLRKLAIDLAKSGYIYKLSAMLREHDPKMLLLPPRQDAQVGPQQTLFSAAQASGHTAVAEVVEEAATDLLFRELSKLTSMQEVEDDIVQQCLHAGANPTRPGGAHGHLPLQHLCIQEMRQPADVFTAKKVAQAASQLAEAAPLVLIMAFARPAARAEATLPLGAAACNKSFGQDIVPVLSFAVSRLLLKRPDLAAAPLLKASVEAAHTKFPNVPFVLPLVEILRAAAPCLDSATGTRAGREVQIWEPRCAYESWTQRKQRLEILRPMLSQVHRADASCEREEAIARLAEVEAVLDRRRRQHSEQIAELQMALDKAQRAAEEASAQVQAALSQKSQRSLQLRAELHSEVHADGKSDVRFGQSLPNTGSPPDAPAELLRNIRQQRGLDIDYSALPPTVLQSAGAMQRSIGAAVERLAIDLYASKGHFLLELIQNADDNRYNTSGAEPAMTLHMGSAEDSSLFFASINNELGMTSKDVEALCDINRSTKPAQAGKIGKKGVGWKAVFAISDQPTVLSGPFRFRFDVRCRGRLGYVTPDDLSAQEQSLLPSFLQEASSGGATVLYLPLRGRPATEDGAAADMGDGGLGIAALIRSSMHRLLMYPAWLLFLRQLRRVAWDDAVSARPRHVSLERRGDSVFVRQLANKGMPEPDEEFAFFVHRKTGVVPSDLLPAGVEPGSRIEEVAIAFQRAAVQDQRAEAAESHGQADRESDPVFCFLPVRPVGFRFSLHAPWSLTSNREDFHLEDPRNVWLRGVAANALAEAIARFGSEPGTNVLTLLDARRVLEPFWRRLLEEAVERIGDAPVVAVIGESKLYRPSEVLVPTPSLVRCTAAMRFIHALPAESWPAATGKRLARLSANEDVAVEDVRRLLSLHAEPVSAHTMRVLLNSDSVKAELTKHCRSRDPLGLAQLCELLSAMLAATQREPEKVPTFSEAGELPGDERLLDVVTEIQQMQVLPLATAGSAPQMTSLSEGDVHLPGSGTWCPGLDEATASTLLAHKDVRVFDSMSWQSLSSGGQNFLRQLGVRKAMLSEVAAAIVRVHSLTLADSVSMQCFSGSFARPSTAENQEAQEQELAVLWAGLDAIRLAREQCLDPARAAREDRARAADPLDPAVSFAPVFRRTDALQMGAAELGHVLWLPTRSAAGEVWLRRAKGLILPTFMGLTASEPARGGLEEHMHDLGDDDGQAEKATVLPPPSRQSGRPCFVVAVPASGQAGGWNECLLLREAFLTELGCAQPGIESLAVDRVAERLVSRQLWEALAKSMELRRHAARVFRENHGWLPDLEVQPRQDQPGSGQRINSFFRRGAFEPVVGEGGLPYVDAEPNCQSLLELLRIRCTPDFENLAVALRIWVDKEPPAMCAPKALVTALLQRAIAERESEPERRVSNVLTLAILRNLIFIPGKGKISAQEAVWSAGTVDGDFARRVCALASTSMLEEIYGQTLRGWFCEFLSVRESPGMWQLLRALQRLIPSHAGGEGDALAPSTKPSLSFLRQLYAEIMMQLEEYIRESVVGDGQHSRLKRRRTEDGHSLIETVESKFQSRRLIILPQTRNRPWKFLATAQAYWSVDDELSELPCSQFALKNFYGVQVKTRSEECGTGLAIIDLKDFFVQVLGVKEVLTREELARRLQPTDRPQRPPQVRPDRAAVSGEAANANMDADSDVSSEDDAGVREARSIAEALYGFRTP